MKKLIIGAILLSMSGFAYAGCNDVGPVIGLTIEKGTISIETTEGFYVFTKNVGAVGKGPNNGSACYDAARNVLCWPGDGGDTCKKVE